MASRAPTPELVARERLPNLFEVLSRRTLAPVDLFSFYIYMRDVQRSVDYLDFWLDVSQHMSLCRHYVRELRRSVLVATPDLEKNGGSKRTSQILESYPFDRVSSEQGPSGGYLKEKERMNHDQRLSAFLRNDNGKNGYHGGNGNGNNSLKPKHSPQNSGGDSSHSDEITPGSEAQTRPSFMTGHSDDRSPMNDSSGSPGHTVSRADIRASAEKILYTFLLQGAEREIILPQGILLDIQSNIENEGRDDPEVFDAAKDYVFQAMERDAFPGFLRAKALGNIVQPSLLLRLIAGLVSIFAAFWAAFILIFLDKSRTTRCWLILPFSVGVYLLATHQYMLDPILALVGYSEYTFLSFHKINETFVRKLLTKRSLMCLGYITVITVALCCLFIFVPGKRL